MSVEFIKEIENYFESLVELRRYLHQYPEASYQEDETSAFVESYLKQLKHAEIIKPVGTSVIAIFRSQKAKKKIGLRADMDALPIHEELMDLDYRSKNEGYMHACGHDGHTAMLLIACQWFNDHIDQLDSDIYCIFQHAEELQPGGARAIMDTSILDDLDFIYGQHFNPGLPLGYVDIKEGAVTTNSDDYQITIQGIGGHSSKPSQAINPVNVASLIIQAINEIPSQVIDSQEPAVISNTFIQSGHPTALNIISDQLTLAGNIRTFDISVANLIEQRIHQVVKGISEAYGVSYQFTYRKGARAVINNKSSSQSVKAIAKAVRIDKVVSLKPEMFGEDFSAYSQVIPATFALIGSSTSEATSYPLHHPRFNIDEKALLVGLKMLVGIALNY